MRKTGGLLAMLVLLAASSGFMPRSGEREEGGEEKAIRHTIELYFKGVAENDVESMKRAFHPDAIMFYTKGGTLQQVTQPQWHERMRNQSPGPKANYRRILSIDLTGDAASVNAIADFETFQYIDYISLLKIDGQWMIINKIFHKKEKHTP
jgi:protease I